jgi:multiple sugar transport system substrate-binding protein
MATTGLAGILAAGRGPAHAQGTKLHVLRWNDFIPQADAELKRQAVEAGKALGAEITFEFVATNDLQPRITASLQSGWGADIIMMLWNWPQLYASSLVDVSDVAEPVGAAQGGFYDVWSATAKGSGGWLAVPHSVGGFVANYRRSWHREIGVQEYPKTWEEWHDVGKRMKAKGKPVGQSLGRGLDPSTFSYPLLWDFGGAEVDESGKRVVINSKATLESVKFLQAFWKDACDESGVGWDDTTNNRAFLAGELSSTANGPSIYILAKRQQDKLKDEKGAPLYLDIDHAFLPKGPVRQVHLNTPFQHAVPKYSKNQKLAKDFLRWHHQRENYEKWFVVNEGYSMGAGKAWEDHPMWSRIDPPLRIMRQMVRLSLMIGYPGPASARATEAQSKFIVPDMYAQAARGMKAEDAVKWAEAELKKVYEA